MSALRVIAIILSLTIISTSSAPQGIEFGIKSKVYFGSDKGVDVPLPTFKIKMPASNPLNAILGMSNGINGIQQPQNIVPPEAMDMIMALLKMAIDSGVAQTGAQNKPKPRPRSSKPKLETQTEAQTEDLQPVKF